MGRDREDNVRSLEKVGDAVAMDLQRGWRWTCSCGETGEWVTLDVKRHERGRAAPAQPPAALLVSITQDWEGHLARDHPDADLTFEEFAEDDCPGSGEEPIVLTTLNLYGCPRCRYSWDIPGARPRDRRQTPRHVAAEPRPKRGRHR